jgi:hypothetical protein
LLLSAASAKDDKYHCKLSGLHWKSPDYSSSFSGTLVVSSQPGHG